jgi:hypothetical protein
MQAKGICGSAIIDVIAEMFRAGILKKNGQIKEQRRSSTKCTMLPIAASFGNITRMINELKDLLAMGQNLTPASTALRFFIIIFNPSIFGDLAVPPSRLGPPGPS